MSDNNNKNKPSLEDLEKLEQQKTGNLNVVEEEKTFEPEESIDQPKKLKKEYNVIDGLRQVERSKMPFGGVFYPDGWEFWYRCPEVSEVANFSTINENDQPKIISAISELVKKCFTIVDRAKQQEVPSHQINDGERLFFFLLLREFYLADKPIKYSTMSQLWGEAVEINFFADSLIYKKPNVELLQHFDGRTFKLPVNGIEDVIEFLIPTIDISDRIFRYMMKTYQDAQKDSSDNIKEAEAFNKQFLLMAPFLYVTGSENLESLKVKFKKIEKNPKLYDAYIQLINNLKITNSENIRYVYKESEEEAPMKFPGGWKNMFYNKSTFGSMFD